MCPRLNHQGDPKIECTPRQKISGRKERENVGVEVTGPFFYKRVLSTYYILNTVLAGHTACRDAVVDQIDGTHHKEETQV